jgi:hypothetical protein
MLIGCRRQGFEHRFGEFEQRNRRKFRSQTSDFLTDAATVVRRVREEKESEKRESGQRRSKCAKGRKVAQHCIFTMVCGSGGRKVGLEMEIGRNIEK